MSKQFFFPRGFERQSVQIPMGYRKTVNWIPKIGDIFPNFKLASTQGPLNFWPWAEDNWVLLFGHPAAKTPVCTTEIGELARHEAEFKALSTKVLGITSSPIPEQLEWHADIEKIYKANVWFPTVEDKRCRLSDLFGMIHKKEHEQWPVRKSFLLDPQMKIRMIFEYPIFIGRSIEETLRVIEAVQLHQATCFATPCNWFQGDPVLVPDDMPEQAVERTLGCSSHYVLPYMRVACPKRN